MAADEVSELLRTFETALQDIERKLQSCFADNADFVKSVRLLQQIRLYLYIFFVILLWYKSDNRTLPKYGLLDLPKARAFGIGTESAIALPKAHWILRYVYDIRRIRNILLIQMLQVTYLNVYVDILRYICFIVEIYYNANSLFDL